MRLSFEPASATHSPSFGLAESIDSDESFVSSSIESSKYPELSSPSSSSSQDENVSSSTLTNLWSTIFTPSTPSTLSTSTLFPASTLTSSSSSSSLTTTRSITTTTLSSLLSSYSSSPLSTIVPYITEAPITTTTTKIHHYHHHHPHPVTPFTATLPTHRLLDFGDKFVREEQRCVALVPEAYDPLISTICGLAVLTGLIYILAGYRLFRSVLFLTGFLIASSLTYGFINLTSSPIPFLGSLVVSLSVGLLTGLVTFLVAWIGLFCLGFNLGTFIGTIIIISIHILSPHVDTISPPQSIWVTFSVIAGWGIIGAFSTLYFQKGCTILATCMFGAAFVIAGLDYFVENFNLFNWFWFNLQMDGNGYLLIDSGPDSESGLFMCLISWILLMLWSILVSLGLFCQWCATGRGYYHTGTLTSTSSSRRNGTLDLVKIRAEESKTEQKQRKYRYLYQVRTAHGDVISQHYIQNFQKKLSPQMDHNDSLRTYNSDLSHLTSYNQSESRTTTMSHLP